MTVAVATLEGVEVSLVVVMICQQLRRCKHCSWITAFTLILLGPDVNSMPLLSVVLGLVAASLHTVVEYLITVFAFELWLGLVISWFHHS